MKVYNSKTTGAEQAHFRFYDFDNYKSLNNFLFIDSPQIFTEIPKEIFNQKICYLELEEPNRFFVNVDWFHHFSFDKYFAKVFSICPYTTKWLNSLDNGSREHVFIPINHQYEHHDKSFDIIYAGHIYPGEIEKDVQILKRFNYCLVSNTENSLVTHKSVDNKTKLQLITKSKISLVHNLLYPTKEHIDFIKTIPNWEGNEAFSLLDQEIVPQIKGRVFESALCKSLILCKKDQFNVIEHFFEPNKEFIYYEDEKQIQNILDNYNDYQHIIDAAYNKAQNYTTKAFFNKYLKDLKI